MKKLTLTLMAILGFSMAMNAQTYVGDLEKDPFFIPGAFTNNGHPYVIYVMSSSGNEGYYNLSIYQSDFTTHVVDINNAYLEFDIVDDYNKYYEIPITQSIFNSDDDFEYVQYDNNWQSFYIKSSNGSTLWTFNAQEGYSCNCKLLKLGDKYYLVVTERDGNFHVQSYHLYFISQIDGLTEVETELPISVFPNLINRGQQITVELGEGNNAKEITVVNSLGQVVKRVSVEEGQREVSIPTKDFGSGLNVVNTRTEQGQGSCKIIVR